MHQVIRLRLDRLSPSAREVAAFAAVIGRAFDFDVLNRAWGQGEEATLEALDELLRCHLVHEGSSASGKDYEFDHHLVQEVIYQGLQHRQRRRIHRQVAQALADFNGDDLKTSAELAYHYRRADQPVEAVQSAIRAGEYALQLYAVQQAADHFGDAIEWAEEAGLSLDKGQLAQLHVNWGDALRRSGRYDEAMPHYVAALPMAQGELKQLTAYHICSVGAIQRGSLADFSRMAPSLEQDLAGAGDTWALAWLRWTQAYIATLRGEARPARAFAANGWHVARRLIAQGNRPLPWLEATARIGMAQGYDWWADWRRAIRYSGKALALYTAGQDVNGIAVSHATLGTAHYGLGEWDRALHHLDQCHTLAAEATDPRVQGVALHGAALVYLERGDWATAEESAVRVIDLAEQSGDVVRQGLGRLVLARLSIRRGMPQEAVSVLQFLLQAARWSEASTFVVLVMRCLAEAHLLAGDADQAASIAHEGLKLAGRSGQRREQGGLLRILGEAMARSGNHEQARQYLEQAAALAEHIRCRYDLAEALRSLGTLHKETGAVKTARERLAAALTMFEDLGARHDAGATRSLLSDLVSSRQH